MIFTTEDVSELFDAGVAKGAKYMVIGTNDLDHSEAPTYSFSDKAVLRDYAFQQKKEGIQVIEVFNLTQDKKAQLKEDCVVRLPKPQAPRPRP